MVLIKVFDQVRSRSDIDSGGSVVAKNSVYVGDVRLVWDGFHLAAFKLRPQVPRTIQEIHPEDVSYSAGMDCAAWHKYSISQGQHYSMDAVFPFRNIDDDFEELEIGSHSWQPKLDVLTERLDLLDTLNALDQEVLDEFVAQLSAGGDAFQLIDAKVLVETDARIAAVASLQADVDQNEQDADAAVAAVQADVDQNELDAASGVAAEESRALGAEAVNAAAISDEIARASLIESALLDRVEAIEAGSRTIYVDSNRTDSYTPNGSRPLPYKDLPDCCAVHVTDSSTETVVIKLAPGDYSGVEINKTNANQSVTIQGSGRNSTFIGSASYAASGQTTAILYLRDFKDVCVRDLTLQNTKTYGFYPRDCARVELRNVNLRRCGSDGTVANHDFSQDQVTQKAAWDAKVHMDNGGATRIQSCQLAIVSNCNVEYCLRGLRLQDVGSGIVTNNRIYRTLEAGIYCASSSYGNQHGCDRFLVSGNRLQECFNNSILVIGGRNNSVMNNDIIGGANAGVQCYSAMDLRCTGNTITRCNLRGFNGIGNNGDAQASIVFTGNAGMVDPAAGTYAFVCTGNTLSGCGLGAGAVVVGIALQSGTYPANGRNVICQGNFVDAASKFTNTSADLVVVAV